MSHHLHPECPFYLANGKVTALAHTEHAFIVQALRNGERLVGTYLAIHVEHVTTEPPWFIRAVDHMFSQLELQIDNRSIVRSM